MRQPKWSAVLAIVVVVGVASGGMLDLAVGTAAWAATENGVTVAGGNGQGSSANQLSGPADVFVDSAGNVYVSDEFNERVEKWAPGATSGVTVAGGNGQGSAANQLDQPYGVFVDGAGDVYVSDLANYRVQEWAPGATSGVTVAGGNGGGPAANQLNAATGVFVDGAGNVYVADQFNDRVEKWAPGATSGVTVAGGHGPGSGANQLTNPAGVSVDGAGNVYVSDPLNNRVQEWAPGATAGVTVAGGNGAGSADNQLNAPTGVALDASGNIYVADESNDRVQEWAPGATAGVTVAGGNGAGSADSQFDLPTGVALDATGNVYVADQGNNRVQEWQLSPNGAPLVTDDPQSQSATQSTNVSFIAGANGRPLPTVQWQQSTDGGSTWSDISGATSYMYTITNVPLSDNGFEFRAVFTNAAGSATSDPATLTVTKAVRPKVTTQPSSQTIGADTSVTFSAAASGTPSPTVQWQQSTDGGKTWNDISGATASSYYIPIVPYSDNGFEFRAVFMNAGGSATTKAATLTVFQTAPSNPTQLTNQTVIETTDTSFTAFADGTPPPTVQWQQSTDGGSTWSDISGATGYTYTILSVPLSDNGFEFRAVFTNAAGSVTTNAATLTVTPPPPPTTSVVVPANGATVSGNTWLDAAAQSPVGIASVTYEASGGSVSDQVIGSATPTAAGWLGVWDTHDVPNGTYSVQSVATDTLGNTTTSAAVTVTVDNPPLQTAVVLPANGATVSGTTYLDASANGTSDVTGVQFELTGGSLSDHVIAGATATLVGWLVKWDTTAVPDGTYTLQSVATEVGGTTATSPGITITIAN